MFTGIIETLGTIQKVEKEGSNMHLTVTSSLSNQLKIDQSIAHNGVCLTVVAQEDNWHVVTAIEETLLKTTLAVWKEGEAINLERAMQIGARLDGHMVQGHVDQTARCTAILPKEGSWAFHFEFVDTPLFQLVEKGSVCIDGVSLTVVNAQTNTFEVAIIPYTYEHTIFHRYEVGSKVNIEFDVIGKYIQQYLKKMPTSIV